MNPIFNYNDSINYLKQHFSNNYSIFVRDFINHKTSSGDNFFSYVKIDDYAVINLSTIYLLKEYLEWGKNNNFNITEFDISKYKSSTVNE